MKLNTFSSLAAAAIAGMTLVACGWVDSTGDQSGSEIAGTPDTGGIPATDGTPVTDGTPDTNGAPVFDGLPAAGDTADQGDTIDDTGSGDAPVNMPDPIASAPIVVTLGGAPIREFVKINEQSKSTINVSRSLASDVQQTFTWSSKPSVQGNLPVCRFQTPAFIAATLDEACEKSTACDLGFEPVSSAVDNSNDMAGFELEIPTLKASIGLRYTLTADDGLGNATSDERTFCLIAINEAPEAIEDKYEVVEGELLVVTLDDDHLLANDEDDFDVSNSPLSISTEAVTEPDLATEFELSSDGTFTYRADLPDLTSIVSDSFEYELTDGLFTVTGTANIVISVSNQAPVEITEVPFQEVTEGDFFSYDLSANYSDPEGSDLIFTLVPDMQLVAGSGLSLSPEGELSGVPADVDVGSYILNINVSDGSRFLATTVALEIAAAAVPVINNPPVFVETTVFDQTVVLGNPIFSLRPKFLDVDGERIKYSMSATSVLPAGVVISELTGVISGTPSQVGIFGGLIVVATDTRGATGESAPFALNVRQAASR